MRGGAPLGRGPPKQRTSSYATSAGMPLCAPKDAAMSSTAVVTDSTHATLALTLDLDAVHVRTSEYRGLVQADRSPTGVAAVLVTFDVLSFLAREAVSTETPLVAMVLALRSGDARAVSNRRLRVHDALWAIKHTFGDRILRADEAAKRPAYDIDPQDFLKQNFWSSKGPGIELLRIRFGSPLDALLQLPWEWFAAGGGGVVFLKAVEYWLNSPGRIRAESAKLSADTARHHAEEAEARRRELVALRDIDLLQDRESPALKEGTLFTPEPFDWEWPRELE